MSGVGQCRFVALAHVEHAEDDDSLVDHLVEHFTGEAPEQDAPEIPMIEPRSFRVGGQRIQCGGYFIEEVVAEFPVDGIIPIAGGGDVVFGFRSDKEQPLHVRRRRRASTSGQGEPALGLVLRGTPKVVQVES